MISYRCRSASRRVHDAAGMTLPEIMITMSIMSIVLLIVTSVLASVQRTVAYEQSLSTTLDDARLAVQELDREMRSGNVLYDPALENAPLGTPGRIDSCAGCLPGYTLRVYTQTNADTRGVYRCVLWKIDSNQKLWTRWWPPSDPADASAWTLVTDGVVNRALGVPAFTLDPDILKGGRTLNLVYSVNSNLSYRPNQTANVQASLTGRNTSYGYPANVCEQAPAG
jgi:prepilin-type N-terminal cleavage/methylation domain-containing protein